MPDEVEVLVEVSSDKCELVVALKKALGPDNIKAPPDMRIEEVVEKAPTSECIYKIKIGVKGDMERSLKRTRSTVDDILAIAKTLNKILELVAKENRAGENA